MVMAQAYQNNIPSVYTKHPELTLDLGLDLNRNILKGQEIIRGDLSHAKGVACLLSATRDLGNAPVVTDAVVESAELREKAVEAAHWNAAYDPLGLSGLPQAVQNINAGIAQLALQLASSRAELRNLRIIARNNRFQDQGLSPLFKTIPGHGHDHAVAIGNNLEQGVLLELLPPAEVPQVGDLPPNFNVDVTVYQHVDILRMVNFYNDTFGIALGDLLPARIDKFRNFLLGL